MLYTFCLSNTYTSPFIKTETGEIGDAKATGLYFFHKLNFNHIQDS